MASDNKTLGRFDLIGLPPAPRGIPQIEVTFDIDANGIVHVTAKDLGTGKEQSVRITATQKLSEAEIERMRQEAEAHAEEDLKRKETAELVNEADTIAYTTDKLIKDFEGKVSEPKISEVKSKLSELKEALKKEPKEAESLRSRVDELNKALQEASTELYQKAGGTASSGEAHEPPHEEANTAGDGEKVVDADYEVKEDEPGKGGKRKR